MAKKNRKKKKSGGELGGFTERMVLFLEENALVLSIIILLIILSIGVYIRIIPALKYKLELDASDPWIVYWEAKYFHDNGLFNLEGLRHVDKFWWPIGRDFTKSEYLGTAWLAAATYGIGEKFGLTLREWLALFPVFAGATTIILIFVLVLRVTRSHVAALSSASFFAFFPGAIVRTTVGFVEKIAIAIPFITLFLIFMFETIRFLEAGDRRRSLINSALAGIFGGLVAYFWGGFIFVIIAYALILLFDPIVYKPNRDRLEVYAIAGVIMLALMLLSPKIGYRFFIMNVGAAIPGALVLYAIETFLVEKGLDARIFRRGIDYRVQLWILAVVVVLVVIAIQSGIIGYSNLRYAAALGIRQISPLVESIQENQPASARALLLEYGVAMLFGIAGFAAFLARLAMGVRDRVYLLSRVFFYFMFFFALYINKQLAYFTQISSFFAIIGGGIGIADIISGGLASEGKSAKKKVVVDPIRVMAGIFIVMVVVISAAYYGYNSYKQNSHRAPQILTSGLGALRSGNETIVPLNNAWLNAFAWIRNNTREDAVIVSWWDYGYWITVNTDRRTVADGVTFNETQIRWLAEVLTGNESTAAYLLKNKFKAEPGNTYIVFYEVFNGIVDKVNKTILMYPILSQAYRPQTLGDVGIIIHGTADFGKSIQMLRISYRVDPFDPRAPFNTRYSTFYVDALGYKYKHFPGIVGEPQENLSTVMNALLYKLAFNGIIKIREAGVFDGEKCQELFNGSVVLPYAVATLSGGGQLAPVFTHITPLKYFKPAAISVSCPIIRDLPGGQRTSFTAVVVFIFEFTG